MISFVGWVMDFGKEGDGKTGGSGCCLATGRHAGWYWQGHTIGKADLWGCKEVRVVGNPFDHWISSRFKVFLILILYWWNWSKAELFT